MRRLFARLFVSVWIAMAVVAAAFVVIEGNADDPIRAERRKNLFAEAVRHEAAAALSEAARGADPIPRLRRFEDRTDVTIFLFLDGGDVVSVRPPSNAAQQLADNVRRGGNRRREKDSARLIGFTLDDEGAVVVGRVRRLATWTRTLGLATLPQKLLVVFVMSGLVSLLLARYLTGPIRTLRHATQRLARGDLDVRVAEEVSSTEELAALGRDFDAMAARVQALLIAQRRLLSDVSHELSSPLARLRVALELARQRAGADAAGPLDRIEREAERLGELIEAVLAVSRFEHADAAERRPIDLVELVERIARDADFEARAAGRRVEIVEREPAVVRGDAEILRRAIENVVRNAVRFTAEGTAVQIAVSAGDADAQITVEDRGPGVPDDALELIFEPLYRVAPDRARNTGGAGLGLAITARAVAAHHGSVTATNRPERGLRVTLRLPLSGTGSHLPTR